MGTYEKVIYEKRGHIAVVTINRPDSMNAIDPQTSAEMHEVFSDFRDTDDLWVAVLTGAGPRAFSAGNDLVAMSRMQQEGSNAVSAAYSRAPFGGITRNFECWKPMIAAINGYCLAGGLEIALSCDIRIAARGAKLGANFCRLGLAPGLGISYVLPRVVGASRAAELMFTGRLLSGEEAAAMGLASEALDAAEVLPRAREIAGAIAGAAPLAVRATKRAIYQGLGWEIRQAAWREAFAQAETLQTADFAEGVAALLEKREPRFRGA